MTAEELDKGLKELRKEFDDKVKNLKIEYVRSSARFKKGDKIRLGKKSIIIERISGTFFSFSLPLIYYYGTMLTKNGVPRKDGKTYAIFENEGIELLNE